MLLGALVEMASGTTLDRFCQERIVRPLGLRATSFIDLGMVRSRRIVPVTEMIAADRALPVAQARAVRRGARRQRLGDGRRRRPRRPVRLGARRRHPALLPAALLGGTATTSLRQALVREFWTRDRPCAGSTWALGWDTPSPGGSQAGSRFSPDTVGHLGFTGTSIWMDLERDRHVVLLTNRVHPTRDNQAIKEFRPLIHDLVNEALDGEGRRMSDARSGGRLRRPVRHVHLVAIAGVAMAALAGMLRARGLRGDRLRRGVYPPMSTLLERLGIPVLEGYRAENLAPRPDLVVIGNKVSRDNPEVQAVLAARPALPVAAGSARHALPRRPAVAGGGGNARQDHLDGDARPGCSKRAGRDPSLLVGGDSLDFGGNFKLGGGAALRHRGRRVRQRLLRQGAEVPPLPAERR